MSESKKVRRFKTGCPPKATPDEMMTAIAATGSQRKAGTLLGLHESTICNALKPFRGTPEWNAMMDKMAKNRLEFNAFIAQELLNNRTKIKGALGTLKGKEYFTAIGIFMTNLNNASRSLDGGDQPPPGATVNIWNIPSKEQAELDSAYEKAKNRLGVQVQASHNGK